MEYNLPVNAMSINDEVEGFYILKSANPKVTANGKPSLSPPVAPLLFGAAALK